MKLERIDHVGINVTDVKASVIWYEKVLKIKTLHVWPSGTTMVGNDTVKLGLFNRPDAVKIVNTDQTICLTHLAFLTTAEDFIEIQAYLNEIDIPFDPVEDTGIAYSIFIHDPDGNQLEFTTYHSKI